MKLTRIFAAGTGFRVLETTDLSQTGLLTLELGEASSDKPSVHQKSDQVLIVLEGEVTAKIGDEEAVMSTGDAVTVPARTPHTFTNTGRTRATTFSVYAAPAFPPNKKEP